MVPASVIIKKSRPSKAIDRYMKLWADERNQRATFRDDVISEAPEGEELMRVKLQSMAEHLADEQPELSEIVSDKANASMGEMETTWAKLIKAGM